MIEFNKIKVLFNILLKEKAPKSYILFFNILQKFKQKS
jgi:hypothetical protein